MRPTVLLLALSAAFPASPCLGQGVPPNPFASNYPSAPPLVDRGEQARAGPARRRPPARNVERGPVPPAAISGR